MRRFYNSCVFVLIVIGIDPFPKTEADLALINSIPGNVKAILRGLTEKATNDFSSVNINFFYGPTLTDNKIYSLKQAKEIVNHPMFDKNKLCVFYLHGYNETLMSDSVKEIVTAYYSRGDHNIIILDYAYLVKGNYFASAVPNAILLSHRLTDLLIHWFKVGVDYKKFHIVGHSLGGQLAGMLGRQYHNKANRKFKRISALDPAFPLFYPSTSTRYTHISSSDAEFVDVIHTDSGLYGSPVKTGTVDFWPNGGASLQPGCGPRDYAFLTQRDLCSHQRSWKFWAESIENKNKRKFLSVKCFSWYKFRANLCGHNVDKTYMGIDCDPKATGNYILQTNDKYPFSKDEA